MPQNGVHLVSWGVDGNDWGEGSFNPLLFRVMQKQQDSFPGRDAGEAGDPNGVCIRSIEK